MSKFKPKIYVFVSKIRIKKKEATNGEEGLRMTREKAAKGKKRKKKGRV
jgi:hypothetical protein